MQIKLLNCTNYANIYGVIDGGKTVGTIEVKLAGREAGKIFAESWSGKYTRRDIRKAWNNRNR